VLLSCYFGFGSVILLCILFGDGSILGFAMHAQSAGPCCFRLSMNIRNWNVLCWNIRGLNAEEKHDAVRDKIEESGCSIVCLQETKIQSFDLPLVRKFAPRHFDKFDFVPSIGASGGILIIWNSAVSLGLTIDKQVFGLTINFTSQHNSAH